jgi:formamidopyrimidine-DNA glycosylase
VPELPEVETIVRDLRPLLVGRRLATVVRATGQELRRPWSADWDKQLPGRTVLSVQRRGKWIVLELDAVHLLIHLGMTGQLTVVLANVPIEAHTHLTFDLEGGPDEGARQLRFRDVRRFGSVTLFSARADLEAFFTEAGLGPEPFDLDRAEWRRRLSGTARCVKAVLLDQRVVAGVGNIYADESLFQARLHPARLGRDLLPAEADRLRKAITAVLHRAIERRGSTIRDYVGGSGLQGGYQDEFLAYGRTGEPCQRCRTPIECIRLGGRSTHFCPRCQQLGAARAANEGRPISEG